MSFREDVSSDSGQIEKARQDLLLACQEAADRAQQEQEQEQERKQEQQKSFSEVPQKPQEMSPDRNQRQKVIHPYRNHNPFVEDILKGIVSEDIDMLRRQLANKDASVKSTLPP